MRTFRDIYRWLLPWWLHGGEGGLVGYSLGLMADAAAERARQGLDARFPTRTLAGSARTLTAQDRGLPRWRDETDAAWAERLTAWRTPRTHRVRGNAYEVLHQVSGYFGGVIVRLLTQAATRWSVLADGTEDRDTSLWDWNGETLDGNFGHFWFFIPDATAAIGAEAWAEFGDADLWGGSFPAPAYCVGLADFTPADARYLRGLFEGANPWHPEGISPEWCVLRLSGTGGITSGDYTRWSKMSGTKQIPARSDTYRYISLNRLWNNTYGGDPTNYALTVDLLASTDEGGDPTNYPAAPAALTVRAYTEKLVFADTVTLVDDGDAAV